MSNSTDQAAPAGLDARSAAATVEQLEQEGDVAADYLEGLLDIADIEGDLTLDVRAGRAYVSVENDDEDALRLLSDPETVQAAAPGAGQVGCQRIRLVRRRWEGADDQAHPTRGITQLGGDQVA